MEEALKWGDDEAIKKADYNWRIVISAVNDIREENRVFNEPSLVEQVIYGKEEEKIGETGLKKLTSVGTSTSYTHPFSTRPSMATTAITTTLSPLLYDGSTIKLKYFIFH